MHDKNLRFDWLQAMRGIAALGVVLTHARYQLQYTPLWGAAEAWLLPGAAGVDLFFVISGFIMAYTTRHDRGGLETARAFMLKRIARIWPAYAIITLATLLLTFKVQALSDPDLGLRFLKSILFIPVDFHGLYAPQTLIQGWTLNYEVYFYGVLAVSLLLGPWRWAAFFGWFVLSLVIVPLAFGAQSLTSPYLAFVNAPYPFDYMTVATNPIIWEFVGGVVVGLIFNSRFRIRSVIVSWIIILAAIVLSLICIFDPLNSHGPTQWGWSFVLLVLAFALASKEIDIKIPAFMVLLGNMSYTLYLVHLIWLAFLPQVLASLGLYAYVPPVGRLVLGVTGSIVMAWVLYWPLERIIPTLFAATLRRSSGRRTVASQVGSVGSPT